MILHKRSSPIARPERDKPPKRTDNHNQQTSARRIAVQQVRNRDDVRTHESKVVRCHCPHIHKPVILLRVSSALSVEHCCENAHDDREDERQESNLWLMHASVALGGPLDQFI